MPASTNPSVTQETPLSDHERELIDRWWRAANYLSVGQIYLLDNPLLKEPLELRHIKPRLLGHWGTTPGLNFLYVHLNRIIKAGPVWSLTPGSRELTAKSIHTFLRAPSGYGACLNSSAFPAAFRATRRRIPLAPFTRAVSLATPCRTPTAPRLTIRT